MTCDGVSVWASSCWWAPAARPQRGVVRTVQYCIFQCSHSSVSSVLSANVSLCTQCTVHDNALECQCTQCTVLSDFCVSLSLGQCALHCVWCGCGWTDRMLVSGASKMKEHGSQKWLQGSWSDLHGDVARTAARVPCDVCSADDIDVPSF